MRIGPLSCQSGRSRRVPLLQARDGRAGQSPSGPGAGIANGARWRAIRDSLPADCRDRRRQGGGIGGTRPLAAPGTWAYRAHGVHPAFGRNPVDRRARAMGPAPGLSRGGRLETADRRTVNVSAAQFASRGLVPMVKGALAQSGLPAERLQLEITETVLMHDPEAANKVFGELRALGVRIALDDFGTGYSSLSYLRLFSFDKIKIDRSFVRELAENSESLAFIRTIVSLGSTLGMPVCVEGVETQDQYDWVCALGCNEIQGFLISRPRPAAQILGMITEGALRAA